MKPILCSLLLLVAVDAVAAQASCDEVGTYNVVVDGVSQSFCMTVTPCEGALDDPANPSRTACPGPADADVTGVRSLSIGSCCASISNSNDAVGCVSLDLINDTRQCLAPPSIDIGARRLRWLQSTKAQESQSLLAPTPIEAVDQSDVSFDTTSSSSGDISPEDGEAITFPPSPSTNQPSDTSGDGAIDSSSPAPTDSTPYPTDSTPSPDAEWDDNSTTTTPAPSTNQPSDTSGDSVGDVTYLPPSAGSEWDDSNTSTTPTPVSTTNRPSDTSGDGVNELTPVVSPVPIDSTPAPTVSITSTPSPSPTTPSPQDLWESIIQSILTSTPSRSPSTSQSSDSSGDGLYGWDNKPTPVPIDATPSPSDWTQSSSFGSRDGSSWSGHSTSSASGSSHLVLGAEAEPEAGDPTGLMKPVTVPAPAPTSTQKNDLETLTPITTTPTENNKQDSYSSDQGGMSSTGTHSFSSKTNTNALFLSIIGVIAVMAVAIGALLLRRRSGKPGQTSVAGTSVLTPRDDEDAMFSPIRVQSAASYRLSSTPGNDRPTRPSFYL
ncbi:hypothetical protein Poli38472_013481 [Pythium oligandrum]|uniref:Uncharacterized protein n=1 Tax=Pythium oligandrum TaxID=41045 RepID=A0A8K1FFU3_PYTOL|nr:hypothetical protein Poli38472_013481 [Pythium oligandrum]|eukprot:TMW58007.1 hypothetical protein Poli38472_013481 [Pythium oligandrum]